MSHVITGIDRARDSAGHCAVPPGCPGQKQAWTFHHVACGELEPLDEGNNVFARLDRSKERNPRCHFVCLRESRNIARRGRVERVSVNTVKCHRDVILVCTGHALIFRAGRRGRDDDVKTHAGGCHNPEFEKQLLQR